MELVGVMAKSLSIICQSSGGSGEVPANWKTVNVIPIHKKKSMREDTGNYRPVILTSFSGKIVECIVLGATENHLKNNESGTV